MKIITEDAVYLQKEDIAYFNQFLNTYEDKNDIPKFMRLFRHEIFILTEKNRYDFVEFRNKEEIEYIKTIEWIIDYNNTKDMTIEQITEYCQQILKERYRIADEYIAMSEEEKIENRTMAIQCAIYEYVINSLASMVYFKMGDIKMKLPKKVRYPKEVRKINPKKMIKSIFNK